MIAEKTIGERIDQIHNSMQEIARTYAIKNFRVTDWTAAGEEITCFVRMDNPEINFRLMFPKYSVEATSHFYDRLKAKFEGAEVLCVSDRTR